MKVELRRYVRYIDDASLPRLLAEPDLEVTELLGITADFSQILQTCVRTDNPGRGRSDLALLDGRLVEPLHQAMLDLPHRVATDMRFWHWLCISALQEVVWHRWYGDTSDSPADALAKSDTLSERFLGSSTLHGVSRNSLARLWWCAETLYSEQDGYDLARQALARQDLFQAVFERQFGLYPPAARACLRRFGNGNVSEREWRDGTRRLNHYLTTIVLESLSEEDILDLLSQ